MIFYGASLFFFVLTLMSYVCIQGNRRFQCLSNYLSNDQSLLCSCSKSKQWSLVTWGKTGTCSETDDENKYKAPLDAFQVWLHDKMLWLQHFITSYILIFCIIVISFAFFFFFWLLSPYIFWGKEDKYIRTIFYSCRIFYTRIQRLMIRYEKYIFMDQGCWLFTNTLEEQFIS